MLEMDLTLWSYAGLQDMCNLIETEERVWRDDGAVETRRYWIRLVRAELIRRDRERKEA